MKLRFPAGDARVVADYLTKLLAPATTRLLVAGSLRRGKPQVGDIEILYIPKVEERPDSSDLFGNPLPVNLVDLALEELVGRGIMSRRPKVDGTLTWGDQIKLALHCASGIPVDFFAASIDNWACLAVCRTGSAENNINICNRAIQRGLKWNPYGLGYHNRDTDELHIRCRTEQEVFSAIGLEYLEPHQR